MSLKSNQIEIMFTKKIHETFAVQIHGIEIMLKKIFDIANYSGQFKQTTI